MPLVRINWLVIGRCFELGSYKGPLIVCIGADGALKGAACRLVGCSHITPLRRRGFRWCAGMWTYDGCAGALQSRSGELPVSSWSNAVAGWMVRSNKALATGYWRLGAWVVSWRRCAEWSSWAAGEWFCPGQLVVWSCAKIRQGCGWVGPSCIAYCPERCEIWRSCRWVSLPCTACCPERRRGLLCSCGDWPLECDVPQLAEDPLLGWLYCVEGLVCWQHRAAHLGSPMWRVLRQCGIL